MVSLPHLNYHPEDGAIAIHNGSGARKRPLYMKGGIHELIYTTDRLGLICEGGYEFSPGILHSGTSKWVKDFQDCTMKYRFNRTEWILKDSQLPGVVITIDVLPLAEGFGWVMSFQASGTLPGDRLVWKMNLDKNKEPIVSNNTFEEYSNGICVTIGRFDSDALVKSADSDEGENPLRFSDSVASPDHPAVCAIQELENEAVTFALITRTPFNSAAATRGVDICRVYDEACRRSIELENRFAVDTPDIYFSTAAAMAASALDGICVKDPPVFYHAGDGWRCVFLGWRTMPGCTDLGWHDQVQASIRHYLQMQIKTETTGSHGYTEDRDDVRMTRQLAGSRLYGKGFIFQPETERNIYNMQTQFFDAAVHEWRSTGDPCLEAILLPALELHMEWSQACFDPDDDGLYESYINTIPTDSMQYSGGGTVEETSYMYNARMAAADMCRRKGDYAGKRRHRAAADKIRNALLDTLFLNDEGYFASYREQGGNQRIHKDAWLYSEFLPIDSGIAAPYQALSSLFYTEWGLERVKLPCGGEMCWNSNWVPQKWSTRWLYGGDNYALAGAYFKTGLGDGGWELVKGNILQSNYGLQGGADSLSPGGFNFGNGEENFPAIDAADITNSFVPAIVSGMFGYQPDYPNHIVRIRPAFPSDWDHASIRTPDFALQYSQEDLKDIYRIKLSKESCIELRLPLRATALDRLVVNGQEVMSFQMIPWFGYTMLEFAAMETTELEVVVELDKRRPQAPEAICEQDAGAAIRFHSSDGPVQEVHDPQHVLEEIKILETEAQAIVGRKPGHHIVLVKIAAGKAPYWKVYKLTIKDPPAETYRAAQSKTSAEPESEFACIDISDMYNGDIRTIYRQKYLSPRPDTVSARIGTDGYSSWTYLAWGHRPPEIGLDRLDALESLAAAAKYRTKADRSGRNDMHTIMTPQNVPFLGFSPDRNIAFTSLWDLWPSEITRQVNLSGDFVWLLVCGSTNCMQGKIENAQLLFRYEDGEVETLCLVHPENFWTLCPTCGVDYDYRNAGWPLPKDPPPYVQLGTNCRAMVLSWKLRPGVMLKEITLECLSQEVIIGLMGITVEGE